MFEPRQIVLVLNSEGHSIKEGSVAKVIGLWGASGDYAEIEGPSKNHGRLVRQVVDFNQIKILEPTNEHYVFLLSKD